MQWRQEIAEDTRKQMITEMYVRSLCCGPRRGLRFPRRPPLAVLFWVQGGGRPPIHSRSSARLCQWTLGGGRARWRL